MPYIADDERRTLLANGIAVPANKAELAFKVAVDVDDYFIDKAVSFSTLTDALTALESVRAELSRRFLYRHEDRKASENGEVFSNLAKCLNPSVLFTREEDAFPTPDAETNRILREEPYDWEQDAEVRPSPVGGLEIVTASGKVYREG